MKDGTVLLIEDDPTYQALIKGVLTEYNVHCLATLASARAFLVDKGHSVDGILIDIKLPDGDGLRLLYELNQNPILSKIPALILSAYAGIAQTVTAFSYGAEDFIKKPFDPIDLKARFSAKVKKFKKSQEHGIIKEIGQLLVDFARQKVFSRLQNNYQADLNLTAKEFRLFTLLTSRLEQIFSRNQILDHVWGDISVQNRTVDSHIAHLRKKLIDTDVEIRAAKSLGYYAALK